MKKKNYLTIFFSALFILLGLVGLFIYEYIRVKPNNVHFSNVTSNSVTVSWNTKSRSGGSVRVYEGDSLIPFSLYYGSNRYFDTRDVKRAQLEAVEQTADNIAESDDLTVSSSDFDVDVRVTDMGSYYTHHVTVTNLDPETSYSFMVGDRYVFREVKDVSGNVMATTLAVPESIKSPVPAYGSVKDANNEDVPTDELQPLSDGIVYVNYFDTLTEKESNIYSGVLNSEGNWYIDLSNAVDDEGNDFLVTYDTPDENIVLEIVIDAGAIGSWRTRQSSYMISPVPDIVLNIPNAIQDLDVEGSVVPIDLTQVKGESTDIFAVLIDDARKSACELNGLGNWTGSSCSCVSHAEYLSGPGYCRCTSGYYNAGGSCVLSNNNTVKTCLSCTPSRPSGYSLTSCPSGSTCDSKTVTCSKQYSDGSGSCGTASRKYYKVISKELADPKCAFLDYCKCVVAYADNTYGISVSCTANDCGQSIEDQAKSRLCIDVLDEDELSEQENLKCSTGKSVDETIFYNGVCKICDAVESNGYYVAKWVSDDSLNYDGTNCVPLDVSEPECGTNAREYSSDETDWDGKFCEVGEVSNTPNFPEEGEQAEWECQSDGDVVNCSASRDKEGFVKCTSNNIGESCGEGRICGQELRCVSPGDRCYQKTSAPMYAKFAKYNSVGACIVEECFEGYSIDQNSYVSGVGYTNCTKENTVDNSPVFKCDSTTIGSSCVVASLNYNFDRVCSVNNKCVVIGSDCSSETLGKWNESGLCSPYTDDELCWSSMTTIYRGSGSEREKCVRGVWVSSPVTKDPNWCKVDERCSVTGSRCIDTTGKAYICSYSGSLEPYTSGTTEFSYWREVEAEGENVAFKVEPINSGELCKENKCRCVNGVDQGKTVKEGEWCRDVRINTWDITNPYEKPCRRSDDPREGSVCKSTGETCAEKDVNGVKFLNCTGPVKISTSSKSKNKFILSEFFNQGVLGQSNSTDFLIDKSSGMFVGLDQGSYLFQYEGDYYSFDINISGDDKALVYIDENENGKFDEDEDVNVSNIASTVEIIQTDKNHVFSLVQGLNFVSFPFLISGEEYRTAAGLLQKLNEVYDDSIYSISKFDGGRWKIVGQNVDVYDNEDFQLLPGEGYMIKAKEDVDISIVGQPVQLESTDDNSPIYLSQGWNLIGLYGTGIKSYTAKTLIEDINKDEFNADNVTQWAKDKQMYEGFQITEGEEYGFDYPLNTLESYFVRITEGRGNWQPSLSGNN